ncbi:MAG: hypothetical protein GXY76_01610 [Chloroflexi bacterium]|nr:hypothetical protein [Chloroflexota bacterium]
MEPRRRGCCGTGCMILGIVLLAPVLFIGWVVAVQTRVPERLGLRQPPEVRLLGGAPDREAAAALRAELEAAGFSAEGMNLAVLPVKGKDYSLAAAVFDASQGFHFGSSGGGDAMLDSLRRLGTGEAATQYHIGRVAVHYYDEEGRNLVSLTAPTDLIRSYASGQITRDAFLQGIEGQLDLKALFEEAMP